MARLYRWATQYRRVRRVGVDLWIPVTLTRETRNMNNVLRNIFCCATAIAAVAVAGGSAHALTCKDALYAYNQSYNEFMSTASYANSTSGYAKHDYARVAVEALKTELGSAFFGVANHCPGLKSITQSDLSGLADSIRSLRQKLGD